MTTITKLDNELEIVEPTEKAVAAPPKPETAVADLETKEDKVFEKDFQEAREQIKELYYQNQQALGNLLEIAEQSDSPRAYEVVAQLLKAAAELNDRVLGLYKQKNEITGLKPKGAETHIDKQQNIIFNGTTFELLEHIKKANKQISDTIEDIQ